MRKHLQRPNQSGQHIINEYTALSGIIVVGTPRGPYAALRYPTAVKSNQANE